MKLQTTTTVRGKKPFVASELKPNGIYSVRHILPIEVVKEWHVGEQLQWGIVVLDHQCQVRRHYHLTSPYRWSDRPVSVETLELYKSNAMERAFADTYDESTSLQVKIQQTLVRLNDLQRIHNLWKDSIWHRIAERLRLFFS